MTRLLQFVLYFVSTVTGFTLIMSIDFKNTQNIWENIVMYFNCFLLTLIFLLVFNLYCWRIAWHWNSTLCSLEVLAQFEFGAAPNIQDYYLLELWNNFCFEAWFVWCIIVLLHRDLRFFHTDLELEAAHYTVWKKDALYKRYAHYLRQNWLCCTGAWAAD